ncbi:hypothetical protein [Deinococcus sp.]|uniref:hypothetical protein n=1 Tax=Deinococcus sp. TaxID=47478 RepID=UPI0025DC65B1|nr:hypothetical protein [Deinococcus sp.]
MKPIVLIFSGLLTMGGWAAPLVSLNAPMATFDSLNNKIYTFKYINGNDLFVDVYDVLNKTVKSALILPNEVRYIDYKRLNEPLSYGDTWFQDLILTDQDSKRILLGRTIYSLDSRISQYIYKFPTQALPIKKFISLSKPYLLQGAGCDLWLFDVEKLEITRKLQICNSNVLFGGSLDLTYGDADAIFYDNGRRMFVASISFYRIFSLKETNTVKINFDPKNVIYESTTEEKDRMDMGCCGRFYGGSLSISPAEDLIAGGAYRGEPEDNGRGPVGWVRDARSGRVKYTLIGQSIAIYQTEFSKDGRFLATRGDSEISNNCSSRSDKPPKDRYGDGTIALRSPRNGKIIRIYKNACTGPFFSSDSRYLYYSDYLNRVHMIDLKNPL